MMIKGIKYYFLFIWLLPLCALGQEKQVFDFSGSSRLETRISSQRNYQNTIPKDYLRWGVNSAITAWGLPVQANWLVSTEQESFKQSLNQFKLSVNYRGFLKSSILEKAPWLKFIRRLDFGKSYPSYSKLSLSGIALDGINAELNPGPLYLAFAYGKIRKSIFEQGYPAEPYSRKMKYFRTGVGDRMSSHIHFGYMKIWDQDIDSD